MMATDPYSWAKEYAAQQYARAAQMDQDKQQMLLSVFNEEAARQRPYVTAPLEMQMFEKKAQIQRRYGTGGKQNADEVDLIAKIKGRGGWIDDNNDGTYTVHDFDNEGNAMEPYVMEKLD